MNIEELRKLCLSLPYATEDVKWENDLCFCIGEKMFCATGLANGNSKASFKVEVNELEKLIDKEGIIPAPYLARYKWVQAEFDALTDREWVRLVSESYKMVKEKLPAKIKNTLS